MELNGETRAHLYVQGDSSTNGWSLLATSFGPPKSMSLIPTR